MSRTKKAVASIRSGLSSKKRATPRVSRGVELIDDERLRQVREEGWTAEHDFQHPLEAMPRAASCYLVNTFGCLAHQAPPIRWPWGPEWWKPEVQKPAKTLNDYYRLRIRELVKAGALCAAAIDRYEAEIKGNEALIADNPKDKPSVSMKVPDSLTYKYHTVNSAGEVVDITDEVHALIRKKRGIK